MFFHIVPLYSVQIHSICMPKFSVCYIPLILINLYKRDFEMGGLKANRMVHQSVPYGTPVFYLVVIIRVRV